MIVGLAIRAGRVCRRRGRLITALGDGEAGGAPPAFRPCAPRTAPPSAVAALIAADEERHDFAAPLPIGEARRPLDGPFGRRLGWGGEL